LPLAPMQSTVNSRQFHGLFMTHLAGLILNSLFRGRAAWSWRRISRSCPASLQRHRGGAAPSPLNAPAASSRRVATGRHDCLLSHHTSLPLGRDLAPPPALASAKGPRPTA